MILEQQETLREEALCEPPTEKVLVRKDAHGPSSRKDQGGMGGQQPNSATHKLAAYSNERRDTAG